MKFLEELEELLKKRKLELPEKSYTADLFRRGIDRILKKIGEEALIASDIIDSISKAYIQLVD